MLLNPAAVAAQVKEERQRRGVDQRTLAGMVGVQRTSITNIENGRQALSLDLFCKIADALGQEPAQFLKTILERRPDVGVSDVEVPNPEIRRLINEVLNKQEG
jgi:transcriptional regulator with XRE-family HTH domain